VHVQPVISAAAVRRLLKRLEPASFPQLIRLIQADLRGRPPLAGELPDSVRQLQSTGTGHGAAPAGTGAGTRSGISGNP
jgi:hypothetical protein